MVRIAVDPVSDPNGNGAAATVIPMPSTFERLLGRLRGLVRSLALNDAHPFVRAQRAAASGCHLDSVRHREALPR